MNYKTSQYDVDRRVSDFVSTNFDLILKGFAHLTPKKLISKIALKYSLDQLLSIFAMQLLNKVTIEFVEMKSFF